MKLVGIFSDQLNSDDVENAFYAIIYIHQASKINFVESKLENEQTRVIK